MKKFKCCICGKVAEGVGNNPEPVRYKGSCCNRCNELIVIPQRIDFVRKWSRKEVKY